MNASARACALVLLALAAACNKAEAPADTAAAPPEPGTPAWKIQNARSAAPPMIAMQAMVLDMRDTTGAVDTVEAGQPATGWVCYVDSPYTPRPDPLCLDGEAMKYAAAWMARAPRPQITGMGVGYALQGGVVASDTDPFKMTPDTGWIVDGPSIYIVMPNASSYRGLPTTRTATGPWVRYAGTPYAYIVLPAGQ